MRIKTIFKYLYLGISWGCVFFVLAGLIGYYVGGDAFMERYARDFARQALGGMLAGICCCSTAIVYTVEKLPLSAQVLIHFAVGLGGYFLVAYRCGWIPLSSPWHAAGFFGIGAATFLLIWSGFYFANRREAARINRKLKELEEREEREG